MPDDHSVLASRIAHAYRASGIAAKVHGGKVFIEREEGWEGPFEPVLAQRTYADELQAIRHEVSGAAAQILKTLNATERSLMEQGSGYLPMYLTDPERFKSLGYDERKARRYVAVVTALSLWKDFRS